MPDKDPDLEYPIFCGDFESADTLVTVTIFRPFGARDWTLEVVDRFKTKTVWEKPFPSDRHAYEEFLAAIASDGIDSFSGGTPNTLH